MSHCMSKTLENGEDRGGEEARIITNGTLELIRLDANNPNIVSASADREDSDYTPKHLYIPPPIVKRDMVSVAHITDFQQTAQTVGLENFQLYIVRRHLTDELVVPTELTGSFQYTTNGEVIRLAGIPMISEINSFVVPE